MQDERIPRPMSPAQLKRFESGDYEKLDDDSYILGWLPDVILEAGTPEEFDVGVFRCAYPITCAKWACGDCECCDHEKLWESPLLWAPDCIGCERPALLVAVTGRVRTADVLALA